MTEFNLSKKREKLIKDIMEIHSKILRKKYVSYGTLKRVLNKVEKQDEEFIRLIKEDIEKIQHDCASLEICRKDEVEKVIDKLAGSKLLENKDA